MHIKNCILDPEEWKQLLRLSKFSQRKHTRTFTILQFIKKQQTVSYISLFYGSSRLVLVLCRRSN